MASMISFVTRLPLYCGSKIPRNRVASRYVPSACNKARKAIEIVTHQDSPVVVAHKAKITPRTPAQQKYFDILQEPMDTGPAVVLGYGAAGCGKTLLAVSAGVEKLRNGEVDRLVITRPAVCVEEEDLGALPGDLFDKMLPYIMPVIDALSYHYPRDRVMAMIKAGVVEVCPMAYMRGRTFERTWVVLDEAQNATPAQIIMMLTRVGHGSRVVLAGDPCQHDRVKKGQTSGLEDLLYRLDREDDVEYVEVVRFDTSDIQRHPVVSVMLKLYNMG
jgi:phosphate starvation-inducible PhoH-like protein